MARLVTLHDTDGEIIYPQTISDMDYSTSEQDTGCKWIDGKPIYKKTINIGALPNNTGKSVNHGIENLERIIKHEGWALQTSDGAELPLPYADTAAGGSVVIYAASTYIRISAASNRSGFAGYITLWYTKTTD